MALVSVLDPKHPQDYFLFVGNDNDFLTQDGFQVGAPYKAPGGADVDTMLLVYQVTLRYRQEVTFETISGAGESGPEEGASGTALRYRRGLIDLVFAELPAMDDKMTARRAPAT